MLSGEYGTLCGGVGVGKDLGGPGKMVGGFWIGSGELGLSLAGFGTLGVDEDPGGLREGFGGDKQSGGLSSSNGIGASES